MGYNHKLSSIGVRFVLHGAKKITSAEIERVFKKSETIDHKLQNNREFDGFVGNCKLLLSMVSDYWRGDYREVPYWAIGAVCFALLYVLTPVDLIPDTLVALGLLDDAAVVGICLTLVEEQLSKYREHLFGTYSSKPDGNPL